MDMVAPLWRKLLVHHRERSAHFKEYFSRMTWEKRKKELIDKSRNGAMCIDMAKDKVTEKLIGYCISTISENKHAELESIYIEAEYRRCGIGDTFVKAALNWMDGHGAVRKVIAVAAGNEEALGFYAKYGFYPRVSILMQADSRE